MGIYFSSISLRYTLLGPRWLHFLHGSFLAAFWIYCFFFLVQCSISIEICYNVKWWLETRNKKENLALFNCTLLEKARHPARIDGQQILNQKIISPSQDSNLAFTDVVPLLYHLGHHRCLVDYFNYGSQIGLWALKKLWFQRTQI